MKIFWSWQSDTAGKIGRFLIRDALKDAISQLKQDPEIEEPVRDAIHVDHDIQEVTGSPDLVRTILGKIDASEVVVADVTVVGKASVPPDADKKLINSNVAIELGYALRALGDGRVLLVFNKYYGTHQDLPFDLRHKGGAIVFDLPPDAERKLLVEEGKKLTARFVSALKPYTQKPPAPSVPFSEASSTFSKASYFEKDEPLAREGNPSHVTYSYDTESLGYIRLIPITPLSEPIRLPRLMTAVQVAPLLNHEHSHVSLLNAFGAIGLRPSLVPSNGAASIEASTQLFENGEIWCVSASLIKTKGNNPPFGDPPFMHTVGFERIVYQTLMEILAFAEKHLSLPAPWQVELGLVGVKGLHLGVVGLDGLLYQQAPIHKTEILHRAILKKVGEMDQLLLDFFTKVHDATGTARRVGYCGFPPNMPGSTAT